MVRDYETSAPTSLAGQPSNRYNPLMPPHRTPRLPTLRALVIATLMGCLSGPRAQEATTPASKHPPDATPSTEELLEPFRTIARDGLEIERLRRTYNHVAKKITSRYPALEELAKTNGIPTNIEDRDALARAISHLLDVFPREAFGERHDSDDRFRTLLAGEIERGRLSLEAISRWAVEREDTWRHLPSPNATAIAKRTKDSSTRAKARSVRTPALRMEASATQVRLVALFVEDFLRHYRAGDAVIEPATPAELARLVARSLAPKTVRTDAHKRRNTDDKSAPSTDETSAVPHTTERR